MFTSYGILTDAKFHWLSNMTIINRWKNGETGMFIIDALMRELKLTSYMSYRGRQIVAIYLTRELR